MDVVTLGAALSIMKKMPDTAASSAAAAEDAADRAEAAAQTLEIDPTLTQAGQAADAKAVGELVNKIDGDLTSLTKNVAVGVGYGINIYGESYASLTIVGNELENALIRKCKKNLFDANRFTNIASYIANATKYYQPYLPIFVKPNTVYKVTLAVVNREAYDATTWNDRQWISNDPNTLSGISSDEFANINVKTVNITSGKSGCLYFVNVWNKQAMLNAFFQCFTVMIVESGIYDDFATYTEYDGDDIYYSESIFPGEYENFIIHRPADDVNIISDLPEAEITWSCKEINVDSQLAKMGEFAKKQAGEISAKNKIVPLFVDTIADYNWVSKYEVTAFSSNNQAYADGTNDGNNGYFAISGNEGDNYVTVITGGNADLTVLTETTKTRWLGGILIDDDGNASPCNFFYKSVDQLYIYPALTKTIINGQLGNMQTGIHLSKRGYKGYAQHIWKINPKHCEKTKYIKKYRIGDKIPFTVYGGKVGVGLVSGNMAYQYQNRYSSGFYNLSMAWGEGYWHNTETGIEWSANVNKMTGYFEAYIGDSGSDTTQNINSKGSAYSFDYPEGAEIHCDLYVDDVLIDSYVKKSKKLERVCLDFANGDKAKVKIYSNQWQSIGYGFSVGAMTWWVNERWTNAAENPYLYKAITQFFDSWGDFQSQEVQSELETLHQAVIGTPVPINNKSRRNMTSQWGRLWFFENVQKDHPAAMITNFGINDQNSHDTTFPNEVAPDGSVWPVYFTVDTYAESMRKLIMMATKNNILPIVMGIGWRSGDGNSVYTWTQAAIDAQAEPIT